MDPWPIACEAALNAPPLPGEGFATTEALLTAIAVGRPVVLLDDEDRENEGDLIIAAEHASPRWINFMVSHCKGLVCVAVTPELADKAGLAPMTDNPTCPKGTAFTVSVDAIDGVTTGISARERSLTVRRFADPDLSASDFSQPGHIFPLIAKPGGLRERRGHTEAAVALSRGASLSGAAVICEILDETGEPMRAVALKAFAARHGFRIGTVETLCRQLAQ